MQAKPTKDQVIALLRAHIHQRPGLDPRDYGDWSNYRSESRRITRQLADARVMLRYVELSSMTADELLYGFGAYSGRLSIGPREDGKFALSYCTGQYWPTEFRAAACAVLGMAIFNYYRTHCMPKPELMHNSETEGMRAGDWVRKTLRREFGAAIQQRWMD